MDTENTLRAKWSKREKDIMIYYPNKPDGHLIHYFFNCLKSDGKSLIQQLEARGYDISTMKFLIKRKIN